MAFTVLAHSAGVLLVAGLVSILYTLITGQLTPRRKTVYLLSAGPLATLLVGIYMEFLISEVIQRDFFPRTAIRISFILSYFILGCFLVLVPWVDRKEYHENYLPARRLTEKLDQVIDDAGVGERDALPE